MISSNPNRRNFIRESAIAGLAMALGNRLSMGSELIEKNVRLGFVGVGSRGTVLLRLALMMEGVEVPAICDINEDHLGRAQRLVEREGFARPEGYSRGPEDFRRLVEREDLDAVITATPKEWHTPVMVAAMGALKYGGTEVPAAVSAEECWQLVETSERTGLPCMMLENYCYFREVLMVQNMVSRGLFGELLHFEVGYQKDERNIRVGPNNELSGWGQLRAEHNGNLYPTHAAGPAAWLSGVNRGDRFDFLVSVSTKSVSLNRFLADRLGPDHPGTKINFANGDVNTSIIRTANGLTITLYYDTQCPRPWDWIFRVQGAGGIFMGNMNKIYIEGMSPEARDWEETGRYYREFEHPLWQKHGSRPIDLARGVCEYLVLDQFIQAVRSRSAPPMDVYDAAAWSVITPLSEQSVANRSAPVNFPDFTRGNWKKRRELNFYGI
ncbi:MAG TPA: Gfo/Idh/MocA family oxidoreductase [archaeon]|nr:Gfo/Idh/MocA family oxidoreductase [archaeon]